MGQRDRRHTRGYNPRVREGSPIVKGRFGLWRFEEPREMWQNDEMVTKRSVGGVLCGITLATLFLVGLNSGSDTENLDLSDVSLPEDRPIMVPPRTDVELPPEPTTTVIVTTIPATTTTTTTLPVVALPEGTRCAEWAPLAAAVGWPAEELPKLLRIMYRESRCNWDSHNKTDPSSGSRGLLQINGYWCRPSQWTDRGWLQDLGILEVCDDLYDPETNLRAGLAIWLYGVQKHGCGWGPWSFGCP